MKSAWYEEWFNRDYLSLYAHRNESEAEKQTEFLFRKGLLKPDDIVLDSACGAGRHLHALAAKVRYAYGLDLSTDLLAEASEKLKEFDSSVQLFHSDMRSVPLDDASVDVVLSMFTSFGYFETDEEHEALLKEWHRVLRPGGRLIIDYLNRPHVLSTLQSATSEKVNGHTIAQQRVLSADRKRIEKQITFQNRSTGETRTFLESVRMYSLDELEHMLSRSGFLLSKTFGDFDGSEYSEQSERLILAAHAEGSHE